MICIYLFFGWLSGCPSVSLSLSGYLPLYIFLSISFYRLPILFIDLYSVYFDARDTSRSHPLFYFRFRGPKSGSLSPQSTQYQPRARKRKQTAPKQPKKTTPTIASREEGVISEIQSRCRHRSKPFGLDSIRRAHQHLCNVS